MGTRNLKIGQIFGAEHRLTALFKTMSRDNAKKLGRGEVLNAEDLLQRFVAIKQFLENNWGRIGWQLQRVRRPDKVSKLLSLVPGIEWTSPFRNEQPCACLLHDDGTIIAVDWRDLRLARQQDHQAIQNENDLFSEWTRVSREADEATTALKVIVSQFEKAIILFPFFFVSSAVAEQLRVTQLRVNSNSLGACYRRAQQEKQALRKRLSSLEARYACNEVVKFVGSKRYEKNPTNFAAAMAGLPDYAWLHSLRRCLKIQEVKEKSLDVTLNYQLFQLLETIIKKTKPLQLKKVEMRLGAELLRNDKLWLLRERFGPEWSYIEQALKGCVGKGISRKETPYRLMAAIQNNIEKPKTIPEQELAKRGQLIHRALTYLPDL
jgi:hypothetical protein